MSEAQDRLGAALEAEAEGLRALLAGERPVATAALRRAAAEYRASWEAAGPRSFGRLVGLLKATLLAGEPGDAEAAYVLAALPDPPDTPVSAYAAALAALTVGDDERAAGLAEAARPGGEAFALVADAVSALAVRDRNAYAVALDAMVADVAERPAHLTGVRIADTAAVLELLADRRGLAQRPASDVLPPV